MSRPFEVLCLIAISHGLVLASVFFFLRQGDRRVNRLFAALMVVTSIDVAFTLYFRSASFLEWPHFIRVNSPLNYLHGPVLFFFVVALTNSKFQFRRHHLWHFLPLLLRALWSLDFYLQPGAEKITWVQNLRIEVPLESYILGSFWQIQRLVYTIAAVILIWKVRQKQKLWWPLTIVVLFTLSWIAALNRYLQLFDLAIQLPAITQTLLIYAIAYLGLVRPKWLHRDETKPTKPKYATSGLDEAKARALFNAFRNDMAMNHTYLENGLTLRDSAKRLGVNPQHLSQAINQCAGMSFNDFINSKRVLAFKQLVVHPEKQHFTLEALAVESGFNSTSTFNTAFRKHTGETPSQFRKKGNN